MSSLAPSKVISTGTASMMFYDLTVRDVAGSGLVETLSELNARCFGFDQEPPLNETADRLSRSHGLILLVIQGHEQPVGFATYELTNSSVGSIVYQSRGLLSEARGRSYGSTFVSVAVDLYHPRYVAGRTQNPLSVWSIMKSGRFSTIYPFDKLYADSRDATVALLELVASRGQSGKVDVKTGLQPKSYSMGKLGDYQIDLGHTGVARVTKLMDGFGLDRQEGDAIYYLAEVECTEAPLSSR